MRSLALILWSIAIPVLVSSTGCSASAEDDAGSLEGAFTSANANGNANANAKSGYALIIKNFNPKAHTQGLLGTVLAALCIPESQRAPEKIDAKAVMQVKVFQLAFAAGQGPQPSVTGLLTDPELDRLNGIRACDLQKSRNFYESRNMPNGLVTEERIAMLNEVLPASRPIPSGASEAEVRARLPEVREAVTKGQDAFPIFTNPLVADQVTSDLINGLGIMRLKRELAGEQK